MAASEIQVSRKRDILAKALRMSKSLLSGVGGKGPRDISGIGSSMSKSMEVGASAGVLRNLREFNKAKAKGPVKGSVC